MSNCLSSCQTARFRTILLKLWNRRLAPTARLKNQALRLEAYALRHRFDMGVIEANVLTLIISKNLDSSLDQLELAFSLLSDLNKRYTIEDAQYSPYELALYNYIGTHYFMHGKYADAIKYYQAGLVRAEVLPIHSSKMSLLHNLGEIFRGILNDPARGLTYYTRAREIADELKDQLAPVLISGTALCHAMLQQYAKANALIDSLAGYPTETLPERTQLLYLQMKSHAQLEAKLYKDAIATALLALQILGDSKDTFRRLNLYLILARAYEGLGDISRALSYTNQFLAIEGSQQNEGLLIFVYRILANCYGALKQTDKQAQFLELCLRVTEAEFKQQLEYQAGIAAAENEHHLLQKDLEIHQLRNVELKEKTITLENTTKKLMATLEELLITQKQLVESEKLAALGRLVTGVAHEINTPIGVALTTTSYIQMLIEEATHIQKHFDESQSKELDDALQLLNSSLEKVTSIVSRFKNIATNQSVYPLETFNFKQLIDDSIYYLNPESRYHIRVDCASDILIHSYRSAWMQIIMELISNAIQHNLSLRQRLEIKISVTIKDKKVEDLDASRLSHTRQLSLTVSDNGTGIPETFHRNVFEPFFTVTRNQGHIGLGLHSLYNLITELFNGKIQLDASTSEGTAFSVIANI